MISESEAEFLKTHRIAHMATVGAACVPEVSPVRYQFDGRYFFVGSRDPASFPRTMRYRNITGGNSRVSIVVDDLLETAPRGVRGIRVEGVAELVTHDGHFGPGRYLRITPTSSRSWGVEPSGDSTK